LLLGFTLCGCTVVDDATTQRQEEPVVPDPAFEVEAPPQYFVASADYLADVDLDVSDWDAASLYYEDVTLATFLTERLAPREMLAIAEDLRGTDFWVIVFRQPGFSQPRLGARAFVFINARTGEIVEAIPLL
jgi:hypothetical protein